MTGERVRMAVATCDGVRFRSRDLDREVEGGGFAARGEARDREIAWGEARDGEIAWGEAQAGGTEAGHG